MRAPSTLEPVPSSVIVRVARNESSRNGTAAVRACYRPAHRKLVRACSAVRNNMNREQFIQAGKECTCHQPPLPATLSSICFPAHYSFASRGRVAKGGLGHDRRGAERSSPGPARTWPASTSFVRSCDPGQHHRRPGLAGAGGFEPPNDGTKIRCLTTWRRPI
jgi:hypothetical protein